MGALGEKQLRYDTAHEKACEPRVFKTDQDCYHFTAQKLKKEEGVLKGLQDILLDIRETLEEVAAFRDLNKMILLCDDALGNLDESRLSLDREIATLLEKGESHE